MKNLTAFQQGLEASAHDDETGERTENPYPRHLSQARGDWYEGYYYEEAKAIMEANNIPPDDRPRSQA